MDESDLKSFREQWELEIKRRNLGKTRETTQSSTTGEGNAKSTNVITEFFPRSKDRDISSEKGNLQEVMAKKKKMTLTASLLTVDIPTFKHVGPVQADDSTITTETNESSGNELGCHGSQDLISLLIRDIDETTGLPFFDISLPKEVCVKIFCHLDIKDLCHCACVSKSWSSLANDELIWQRIYKKRGFMQHGKATEEQKGWKELVRDGILRRQLVTRNWKERICQTQTLEYEKGGVLTACELYNNVLIAGYANGKTCLWNIDNNWKHTLEPAADVFEDPAKTSVECMSIVDDVCATAFSCGVVNVWHTDVSGHPVYQFTLAQRADDIALASCQKQSPLLLTSSGVDVRVDQINDDGQWALLNGKTFGSQVNFANLLTDESKATFAVATKEEIFIYTPKIDSLSELDKISGSRITAVTSSKDNIAVGWAPFGFNIGMESSAKVRLYNAMNGRYLESFTGHYAEITCLNLNFNKSLVTGCKDKRVRVYDLRTEAPQLSLRGHSSAVTTVQMDSWKVVSGAFDGTFKVWDIRMGMVLWETHTTHPVRLCRFHDDRLVTVNIPLDKMPRESMWYADDLILHRRHRGSIQVFDFGCDGERSVVPEEMTSNYDDIAGYNYNINLVAPYDALTSEIN